MPSSDLLFDVVIAVTLAAAVISVAALAARRATAAVRNTLWRIVVLAFWIVPISVAITHAGDIDCGMVTLPAIAPVPAETPPPQRSTGEDPSTGAGIGTVSPTASAQAGHGVEASAGPLEPIPTPASSVPTVAVLLGVWLAGMLLAVALLMRDAWLLRAIVRSASPPAHLPERPAGDGTEPVHVGRTPPMLASERVPCPVAAGVLRPVILVPTGCAETECSGGVLAHELAHIARGDLWMLLLARIARCVWWWHPLVWLAARGLESTSEEACDDWAVAVTGDGRGYADSIVRWAEAGAPALGMPVSRCGANLIRRVKRIIGGRVGSPHIASRTRGVLVAGAVIVMLLAGVVQLRALQASPLTDSDVVRILVLGTDEGPHDRGRSDAIMVAMLNMRQRRLAVLSVPRDLRVDVPGQGRDKINSAYAFGGAELSVRTVEALAGQQMDGYVVMRIEDLERMVDALGGVELVVPDYEGDMTRGRHHGMHYTDNWGKLEIALEPGRQRLDGEQAVGFARYRHSRYGGAISDIGRVANQQVLLSALFDQKLRGRSRAQLLDVIGTCLQYMETDMSWADLTAVARVLRTLTGSDVRFETVPIADSITGGIYYALLRPDVFEQRLQAIALHLGVEASEVRRISPAVAGVEMTPAEPAATSAPAEDAVLTDSHAEASRATRTPDVTGGDGPPTVAAPSAAPDARPSMDTDATLAREPGPQPPSMEMVWPTDGDVTNPYGMRYHPILKRSKMHAGIDIAAPSGAPIRAAAEGTVVEAGWSGAYGMRVLIDHGDGVVTSYGHLRSGSVKVEKGQTVAAGQEIAACGSTGWSTGPHLGFEVHVDGEFIDPEVCTYTGRR